MSILCTKVIQNILKCLIEIFPLWLSKGLLQLCSKAWLLLDSNGLAGLIFYHEKYHFLLELLSYGTHDQIN